ncbi:Abl interactor 2 [Sarcoptes scabiei]|nr:Abl interactor 2 [Sarcoptes scabiei]
MVMETVFDNEQNETLSNGGLNLPHSNLDELCSLLRHEIPESRQTLLDTQTNLEKVADYCSTAYIEEDNKRLAFEKTKNYTTHSLASVAYQINTLAYNILQMLELQTNQISEMESQLNYISQKFQFHNEKVARRKIALLTTAKTIVRQPKVLIPANNEKQAKYIRKPIDYSLLDDIGHGVKIFNNQGLFRTSNSSHRMSGVQTLGPKSSISSLSHYNHYNTLSSGPAPTTKPPTPPQAVRSGYGTLSRSSHSKEYRALAPPIAPPQVPKNYEQNYPLGHPKSVSNRLNSLASQNPHQNPNATTSNYITETTYSHYNSGTNIPGNISNICNQSSINHSPNDTNHSSIVPLDPNESLPEPPPLGKSNSVNYDRQLTAIKTQNNSNYRVFSRQNVPEWVPGNYIEKVIAIYDYVADKDDELTFQENSVIYVTKKNDDGWFEGVMNGVIGLFPGNYVEPCI